MNNLIEEITFDMRAIKPPTSQTAKRVEPAADTVDAPKGKME